MNYEEELMKGNGDSKLESIKITPFFKKKSGKLFQRIDVSVDSQKTKRVDLEIRIGSQKKVIPLSIREGKQTYNIYLPEINSPEEAEFSLSLDKKEVDIKKVVLKPRKHCKIFLIHYSHHDLGYTDLPSNVLNEHDRFYDDILRFCDMTNRFPEEAKFRYVVEQSWSIVHFVENRPKRIVDKLIKYIKEGRIEITALYGNLITELCGHEELIRALYPSFQLKRKYNVPIHSAEHNDIPGLSWGLATVLSGAGVRYFSPGIPVWYFSQSKVHPFWDESKVIPLDIPGAFRWKGPDGGEVIFWRDLHGGELYLWSYQQVLSELPERLDLLEKKKYPFDIISYTIRGGGRDNSPPSLNLSHIVKEWNEKWAFPKLILATNYLFFKEFEKEAKGKLPIFSGELPATDYNVGATCSAKETGINRITHNRLNCAEKFATIAAKVSDYLYPAETIEKAYNNMLLYDEHTWGFHHPIGPAQDGNWSEKSNFAYKVAALSHDVLSKSLNKIVDEIRIKNDGPHIVVFNPLSFKRADIVRALFKEHSPCGFPMHLEDSKDGSYSKLVCGTAIGRNIINLPIEILEKGFDLVDLETEKRIPYQIVRLDNPLAPIPYAVERYVLGQIDKSELFEIVFLAEDVPPMGYKSYRLAPSEKRENFAGTISAEDKSLENRFFKIILDSNTGTIEGIYDKELQKEIIDKKAPHKFNQFIARWAKTAKEESPEEMIIKRGKNGPVYGSLIVSGKGTGCPQITEEIILYDRIKRIDISNRILRDSTPLLEHYFAFPFLVENPQFRFEGANSVIEPIKDQFPGSNTDYYTMQHWASIFNEKIGITFSSIEAPVIEFGGLWPGYVSGAHHCVAPKGYGHEFEREGFSKGYLYSYVMNNNFRTNFKNVQVTDVLFRYSITTQRENWKQSYRFGWMVGNPLIPVCINGKKKGSLPRSFGFCQLDKPNILLLTLKEAEDKNGFIVRLIETQGKDTLVKITLPFLKIKKVYQTNLVEENQKIIPAQKQTITVSIKPFGMTTIRIQNE